MSSDDEPLGTGESEFKLEFGDSILNVKVVNDFMAGLVGGFVCPGSLRLAKYMLGPEFPAPESPFGMGAAATVATTTRRDKQKVVRRAAGALQGRSVVDIGAGCGLLGMTALKVQHTAHVAMTDRPDVLGHLRENIRANDDIASLELKGSGDDAGAEKPQLEQPPPQQGFITCQSLSWGEKDDAQQLLKLLSRGRGSAASDDGAAAVDFLFAGDCFYQHEAIPLLLSTMRMVCGKDTHAYVSGVPCPQPGQTSGSVLESLLVAAPVHFVMHLVSLSNLDPYDNQSAAASTSSAAVQAAVPAPPHVAPLLSLAELCDPQYRHIATATATATAAVTSSDEKTAAAAEPATAPASIPTAPVAYVSTEKQNAVLTVCDRTKLQPTHLCQGVWLFKLKSQDSAAVPVPVPRSYITLY